MNSHEMYLNHLSSITSTLPSSNEIISNITEFTQCGICYEQYNSSSYKPLSLPCGHTLCFSCLSAILSSQHYTPKCPYDKTQFPSRNINTYPYNFNYLSIINYISNLKHPKPNTPNSFSYLYSDGLYEGELIFITANSPPQRHGHGQMTYKNGSIYIGNWCKNSKHGKGTFTCNDYIYEGEWEDDKFHGKGKCIYKVGRVRSYEGGWIRGKCFGYGKVSYDDGSEMEAVFMGDYGNVGEYVKKRNVDNSLFIGRVVDDEVIGDKGYEISKDGDVYYGRFVVDEEKRFVKEGEDGVCYLRNGNVFVGDFKGGDAKFGKVVFENGDVYEGEVKEFKRNGKGVLKYKDGCVYEGMFVDDVREGEGKIAKGEYWYEGMWKGDRKEGNGFEVMENGEKYCGEYRNGMRDGNGVFVFKNGDSYKGEWKEGVMDGKGIIVTNEGYEIKGVFAKGKFIGKGNNYKYKNECVIW